MNAQFSDQLNQALAPIEQASGLPNWFYTSKQAVEEEKAKLFAPNWVGVGFAKDVPEPGDVKPVEFLGNPFILVHGKDRKVRVFNNACRHRGVKLVEKPGKTTGLLRCPYHAWCYSTEGALKQTPHVGGPGIHEHKDIDKSTLGLIEVRSHTFMDVVFINMSGDALPFEEHFKSALERWNEFNKPVYHGGEDSSFKLSVKTNWKLAVENFCEAYHLPFVHPGLNERSKLEDHANILSDGPWSGQLTRAFEPATDEKGRHFKFFDGLSERWDTEAEYLAFYPNVQLGVHKDHTFALILEPQSTDETLEHIELYYTDPSMTEDEWANMREENAAFWESVFLEDIGVVQAMQMGRRASGFDGGHFSPVMDEATHHFHGWVAGHFIQQAEAAE